MSRTQGRWKKKITKSIFKVKTTKRETRHAAHFLVYTQQRNLNSVETAVSTPVTYYNKRAYIGSAWKRLARRNRRRDSANRRCASRISSAFTDAVVLTVRETCNPPVANCTLFSFVTCCTRDCGGSYNQSCGCDTTTNLKGRQKSERHSYEPSRARRPAPQVRETNSD